MKAAYRPSVARDARRHCATTLLECVAADAVVRVCGRRSGDVFRLSCCSIVLKRQAGSFEERLRLAAEARLAFALE